METTQRGTGRRPSGADAVPSQRDRIGQGLVRLRCIRLLVHVGQPRDAGHVLQLHGVRLGHERLPIAAILVTAVAMTFLAITYAGLVAVMPPAATTYGRAASSTALRARSPAPRDRHRGVPGRWRARPGQHDRACAWPRRRRGGWRARAVARRDRVRARGHRLVADPRPLGTDLRRDPQPSVRPAVAALLGITDLGILGGQSGVFIVSLIVIALVTGSWRWAWRATAFSA